MGTETVQKVTIKDKALIIDVKLNNPQMGTETRLIKQTINANNIIVLN